jgi:E3 ubiquitin-protein ligase TRIP12
VDFPASIVREGGLSACLTYLDFFPTSTQRKAVTTAANCCRNIPQDSFPVVRDVMPVLLNVLSSSDQKVVEQGCLCVSRMVDSFKNKPEKLEELLSPELLRAVLRLLLPGTTNLIGQNVHTQFLRVLATTARASPRLSVELLKMNVVDTLYQMLTGVSPPADTDDASTKIDSVVVMQALIHRPKEQISETLNVICELLPRTPESSSSFDRLVLSSLDEKPRALGASQTSSETRANLFQDCQTELKRFANVLLPTLTDAYSSTVNLSVRQKVLTGQLKIFHNIEPQIIEDSLRIVPYSSFLASILSQQDHPSLVIRALQIANMLCDKLPQIYQYQFQREGVMTEIKKLAETPLSADGERIRDSVKARESNNQTTQPRDEDEEMQSGDEDDHEGEPERIEEDDEDDDDDEDREDDRDDDDMSDSIDSGLSPQSLTDILPAHNLRDFITLRAQKFIEDQERGLGSEMHDKAIKILQNLQSLSGQISAAHSENPSGEGEELFSDLAVYFDNDALGSITSSELLNSGIIHVLLDILDPRKTDNDAIRASFLEAFMGSNNSTSNGTVSAVNTPFSILINKLQDLLSRAEHFEVITVNPGSPDVNRTNATSMLGKQIRLKLVAEDEDDVPKGYKMLMVSIHAICTFKALDDYLRPRISLSEQPRGRRTRDSLLAQLADPNRLRDRQMQLAAELAAERAALIARDQGPSTPTQASARQIVGTKKSPSTAGPANAPDVASNRRRSSRRHQQPPPSGMPPLEPPLRDPEESRDPLECADERQLTDDEEGEEQFPPQSIDDLDEDMSDDVAQPDPSAVNMEVASTGRVTARQEDGTRVATPQNSTPVPTPSAKPSTPSGTGVPATTGPSLASAGRPMSYAAAMAAIPQDWHIGFSVDDRPISSETTVYRAVHHNRQNEHDVNGRAIWSSIHTIKYKRVRGPPPAETGLTPPPEETTLTSSGMPASLDGNTTASTILRLLKILHELNADIEGILIAKSGEATLKAEPLSLFINTKLTAKLNRQMEEPLIVASNCLPSWSEDLARLFPFLFPFETRHLFLQSTSYGYSRSMMRWQNTQPSDDDRNDRRRDDRPMLGRLQRQKVRISRSRILESAVKVMELYGASPSMLEVEYFEEVGTGLGPTLEFYSTVSKEFAKKKLKLWRENESSESGEYSFGKLGLFPAPMSDEQAESESGKKLLHLFKMLGKFVARSMLDSRIIDISFNPTFFRIGDITGLSASLGAIKAVDGDLANSLLYLKKFADANTQSDQVNGGTPSEIQIKGARIEDLGLDFTLPGYPHISLVPNGHDNPVTIENVGDYVDKIIEFTIGKGVIRQIEAFRAGFSQVFPYTSLKAFTPNELVMLFGRVDEDWSIESKSTLDKSLTRLTH